MYNMHDPHKFPGFDSHYTAPRTTNQNDRLKGVDDRDGPDDLDRDLSARRVLCFGTFSLWSPKGHNATSRTTIPGAVEAHQ